jgi:hypothetical protein
MFSSNTSAVSADAVFVEDVMSTTLYTGNGAMTITNGIDLAGKGGMVWAKNRDSAQENWTFNSAIGTTQPLSTNLTASAATNISNYFGAANLCVFNSNGFSFANQAQLTSSNKYASWTFRKQPKFFDVVTYTGNGVSGRSISHNLGSVPGCIIVKRTDQAANWAVYHRGVNGGVNPQNYKLLLNLTNAQALDNWWNDSAPTSTAFQVSSDPTVNDGATGATYVAYLFAHDAGGFGLTGTDNVISCGSLTSTSGVVTVTLGYEPQWLLIKNASNIDSWYLYDTMRGMSLTNDFYLFPNRSDAEGNFGASYVKPTATGFTWDSSAFGASGETYIYIAIRRGPMKTPTSGTSVFTPLAYTGNGTNNRVITGVGFPLDLMIQGYRSSGNDPYTNDRLRGPGRRLFTDVTNAEASGTMYGPQSYSMDGYTQGSDDASAANINSNTYINWVFRRAPGFFDVVCYTGTGSATTQTHNLGVVPELMITKRRDANNSWPTFFNMGVSNYSRGSLNLTDTPLSLAYNVGFGLSSAPTSTAINLDSGGAMNASGGTYVAYLFASCPGVSKVGTYTGTGALQTVNCGFTGGARFVLIRRTDSSGDWYVWDSARGIVAGNDSYLVLNSTAAEVTNTDWVDTYSAGFELSNAAGNNVNINGASYIFLSVA